MFSSHLASHDRPLIILCICRFEKMHPAPVWATEARKKIMKKKRARESKNVQGEEQASGSDSDASSDDDVDDEVDELFRTTTGTKRKYHRNGLLESGEIDIDRVRDANQVEATSGAIVEIGFHSRAQVLFSATSDRRLRLFQVCSHRASGLSLLTLYLFSLLTHYADRRYGECSTTNNSCPRATHHFGRFPSLRLIDSNDRFSSLLHVIRFTNWSSY